MLPQCAEQVSLSVCFVCLTHHFIQEAMVRSLLFAALVACALVSASAVVRQPMLPCIFLTILSSSFSHFDSLQVTSDCGALCRMFSNLLDLDHDGSASLAELIHYFGSGFFLHLFLSLHL
jgi:hypothetical protein